MARSDRFEIAGATGNRARFMSSCSHPRHAACQRAGRPSGARVDLRTQGRVDDASPRGPRWTMPKRAFREAAARARRTNAANRGHTDPRALGRPLSSCALPRPDPGRPGGAGHRLGSRRPIPTARCTVGGPPTCWRETMAGAGTIGDSTRAVLPRASLGDREKPAAGVSENPLLVPAATPGAFVSRDATRLRSVRTRRSGVSSGWVRPPRGRQTLRVRFAATGPVWLACRVDGAGHWGCEIAVRPDGEGWRSLPQRHKPNGRRGGCDEGGRPDQFAGDWGAEYCRENAVRLITRTSPFVVSISGTVWIGRRAVRGLTTNGRGRFAGRGRSPAFKRVTFSCRRPPIRRWRRA